MFASYKEGGNFLMFYAVVLTDTVSISQAVKLLNKKDLYHHLLAITHLEKMSVDAIGLTENQAPAHFS